MLGGPHHSPGKVTAELHRAEVELEDRCWVAPTILQVPVVCQVLFLLHISFKVILLLRLSVHCFNLDQKLF